jgi:cytochrome c2
MARASPVGHETQPQENPNAVTSDGQSRTPLHIAERQGLQEMSDYLLGMASFYQDLRSYLRGCHSTKPDEGKVGPTLWGIVGRDKAAVARTTYSETLKAWRGTWTYEDLNTYLYGPTLTTPGTLMDRGVPMITKGGSVLILMSLPPWELRDRHSANAFYNSQCRSRSILWWREIAPEQRKGARESGCQPPAG